jgi:hypothetical protein
LDGRLHDKRYAYDETRTRFLESLGFTVVRFRNIEIYRQRSAVLAKIQAALTAQPRATIEAHKYPTPSPHLDLSSLSTSGEGRGEAGGEVSSTRRRGVDLGAGDETVTRYPQTGDFITNVSARRGEVGLCKLM